MTTADIEHEAPESDTEAAEVAFDRILATLGSSEEFAPYRQYHPQVSASVSLHRPSVVQAATDWIDEQRREQVRSLAASRRVALLWTIVLGSLAVGFAITLAIWVATAGDSNSTLGWVNGVLYSLLGASIAFSRYYVARARRRELDAKLRSAVATQVAETLTSAYALATRDELSSLGVIQFPLSAPRLVELGSAAAVSLPSSERVARFVNTHETSTLGISGPRGVGKTTLIHALAQTIRDRGGLAVVHAAPVEYDPIDFLRGITHALLDEVENGSWKRLTQWRARRRRFVIATVALISGALILIGALVPGLPTAVVGFFLTSWPFILAGGVLFVGLALLITAMWPAVLSIRRDRSALFRQLVEELDFDIGRSGYFGSKAWGVAELRITRERARRQLTHSDLVKALRRAVGALTGPQSDTPVMLAIDELDKLPDRDAAIRAVNVLKDLHRIPGVHVLVTVSDEARAAFGMFGPQRDAFDSTFDAIFELERLSPVAARDVVDSRAVGFPLPLLISCYVASAGLPRDLIRQARAVIDYAAELGEVPPWVELARRTTLSDAQVMLTAYGLASEDLKELPRVSEAIARLSIGSPTNLSISMPESIPGSLSRVYSRTAIRLLAIEWIERTHPEQLLDDVYIIERLRDAMLLTDRDGAHEEAIALAVAAVVSSR